MTSGGEKSTGKTITAAVVVIGDEILSGRTKDQNIGVIADHLTAIGIQLREVRIVGDDETEIVEAVNSLRAAHNYVFTTGGIGPTHDDITADSIAAAFGVGIDIDERAVEQMRARYDEDKLTEARLRMARIPHGAELVYNSISMTPGFKLENVIVMAGVPAIMRVMLEAVTPQLERGDKMLSRTIRVMQPEGDVAPGLSAVQGEFDGVAMGSYPFFEKGTLGTNLVLRSTDPDQLEQALKALLARLQEDGLLDHVLLEDEA